MARTYITVRGVGRFPLDMLRYDGCSPRNTEDAIDLCRRDDGYDTAEIQLICHDSVTSGRWASFGWKVVSQSKRP